MISSTLVFSRTFLHSLSLPSLWFFKKILFYLFIFKSNLHDKHGARTYYPMIKGRMIHRLSQPGAYPLLFVNIISNISFMADIVECQRCKDDFDVFLKDLVFSREKQTQVVGCSVIIYS